MIRQHLQPQAQEDFTYRGKEPGRLENFSDAVFALAITLLLISTSPPANFMQIRKFLFDLLPFIMCIALIIYIWHEHFTFFLRYGLRDTNVVVLNTMFLILVLFFVYPLKFLTKLALFPIALAFDVKWLMNDLVGMIQADDMADLMIIYGVGAMSTSSVLSLMYRYALSKKEHLGLSPLEIFDTRASLNTNMLNALIPGLSVLMAIVFYNSRQVGAIAGFTYFLYAPIMTVHGIRLGKQRLALKANAQKTEVEEEVLSEQ